MNLHFQKATSAIPELFERLVSSEAFPFRSAAADKGRAGIYVFYENDQPVHVGRTGNLAGRLRAHVTRSHYSASFAFKRARHVLKVTASYKPIGSRGALAADDVFGAEFTRQIDLVRSMHVRFIELRDPVAQYLLELYAHMEFGLLPDEFENH